jgi:hypothetical protein
VYLIGFAIEIYYDARSYKRQFFFKPISNIMVRIKHGTEINIGCQRNQPYSLLNKRICGCMISDYFERL